MGEAEELLLMLQPCVGGDPRGLNGGASVNKSF